MRQVQTEVSIAAPIDKVWSVITDFESWQEWNPAARVSGNAAVGNQVSVTISGEDGKDGAKYKPVVLEMEAPKRLRWCAKMMGGLMFKNDRIFELSEAEGKTRLVHREEYSGLMVAMMWGKLKSFVGPHLEQMNDALKGKLED